MAIAPYDAKDQSKGGYAILNNPSTPTSQVNEASATSTKRASCFVAKAPLPERYGVETLCELGSSLQRLIAQGLGGRGGITL